MKFAVVAQIVCLSALTSMLGACDDKQPEAKDEAAAKSDPLVAADLAWYCDQARAFTAAASDPLNALDHAQFEGDVAAGHRAPTPGAGPRPRPAGKLYRLDDRTPEHEFQPEFPEAGQSGCELVKLLETHATNNGIADWSCPELKTAVGCKG